MAIFGSFDEMTPAEVLTVVGKSTGTIFTRCAEVGAVDIHVHDGLIVGLDRAGRPASDTLELHGIIADLLQQREGTFEFRRRTVDQSVSRSVPAFEVPLAQLVMSGLTYVEEIRAFQDALPSPKTIFTIEREPLIWLGDQLQSFYERTEASLQAGASADELAVLARVSVDQACWFLYKLRLAGVIRPRRGVVSPASSPARLPVPAIMSTAYSSVVPSMTPARLPVPATTFTAPASTDVDLRHVRIARPKRSILGRLISGISGLIRPQATP